MLISSSQGTAAGLTPAGGGANYPSLISAHLSDDECHYWLMSDNSLATIDTLFGEMIDQVHPEVVVLQCGIIEAAERILPSWARGACRILPGGKWLSGCLHHHRVKWLNLLTRLGIRWVELPLANFNQHLDSIEQQCAKHGYRLVVAEIPLLSDRCEAELLPGNNTILNQYNDSLKEWAQSHPSAVVVNIFAHNQDETRNTLYIDGTVHFSVAGHQLIAQNLLPVIKQLLI